MQLPVFAQNISYYLKGSKVTEMLEHRTKMMYGFVLAFCVLSSDIASVCKHVRMSSNKSCNFIFVMDNMQGR